MSDDPADNRSLERHAPIYELALTEACRTLDVQERAVEELRSRAGVLVAGAAITTSFFGSRATMASHPPGAIWAAIVAFALVGATVLIVLWPHHDWKFSVNPAELITDYAETRELPLPLVHRELALHRAASHAANARRLQRLSNTLRAGLVLLVIEASAWVVALAEAS